MANFPLTDTLIGFTRTLFLFKVTCHELRYQVFVVLNSHKSSLFLFDLMCDFYFNMVSGSDCAVRLGRSRLARLITKSVYTGVSE